MREAEANQVLSASLRDSLRGGRAVVERSLASFENLEWARQWQESPEQPWKELKPFLSGVTERTAPEELRGTCSDIILQRLPGPIQNPHNTYFPHDSPRGLGGDLSQKALSHQL